MRVIEEVLIIETVYPVAEWFLAPQGEAGAAGRLMFFLRLAGCNVGKPFSKEERMTLPLLPVYAEKCHSIFGGKGFQCDTNYRMSAKMTLDAILDQSGLNFAEHICITGGEPLMHDLYPLVSELLKMDKHIHIETSGTKSFKYLQDVTTEMKHMGLHNGSLWITCSPKKGCLEESIHLCDELKILVSEDFNEEEFEDTFLPYIDKVWFSAINEETRLYQCQWYEVFRIATEISSCSYFSASPQNSRLQIARLSRNSRIPLASAMGMKGVLSCVYCGSAV